MKHIEVAGTLFDGLTSQGQPAKLLVDGSSSATLSVGGTTEYLKPEQLKVSSRLGNSARYIQIQNFGKFETKDNERVDQIDSLLNANSKSSFLHKLESNLALIGVALLVTAVVVWALVKWGIPAAADEIVDRLPDKTADYIEASIIEQLEDRWFKPSKLDTVRQDELQALFHKVATKLGANSKGYHFQLRDAEKTVGANALAFPSGTIIMTDQLVKLVENDEQIAGVLAHEIGHLEGKHSLRQIVRGSIMTFLVAFIAGDVSGASAVLIAAPTALIELRYSRDFETEADSYALEYIGCDKSKLDKMANFFQLLDKTDIDSTIAKNNALTAEEPNENGGDEDENKIDIELTIPNVEYDFLLTHPKSEQRSEYFRTHFEKNCLGT